MSMTEAPFSVTFKTRAGDLLTTRGETKEEFRARIIDALALKHQLEAGTLVAVDEAQAMSTLDESLGVSAAQSSVGVAPAYATQTAPAVSNVVPINGHGGPPGVEYAGDCPHGQRRYVDTMARGKPWRRWECPLDRNWENCPSINAKFAR